MRREIYNILPIAMIPTFKFWILTLTLPLILTNQIIGQSAKNVWFVQAGAEGGGRSVHHPFGTSIEIETYTKPGDIILILPSEKPLSGGLILKEGQELIGIAQPGSRNPVITNIDSSRMSGIGIILAKDSHIRNINIENTYSSGVYGKNVTGAWIDQVTISKANQSLTNTDFELPIYGRLPHGGIVLIKTNNDNPDKNRITSTSIIDPAGVSIGFYSSAASEHLLSIQDCQVLGGSPVAPPFDCSILSASIGEGTQSTLELMGSKVSGRMSRGGRNLIVLGSSKARSKARLFRSTSGEVGQDGVLGAVWMSPAQVSIDIEECTLEKAMTNIEGTIMNFPSSDSTKEHESLVSINVNESLVHDARITQNYGDETVRSGNIIMGSSPFTERPLPLGKYKLSVSNSRIENGRGFGLYIGLLSEERRSSPERADFEVWMRNNVIKNNGEAELILSALNADIDARQNCWNTSNGITNDRMILGDGSTYSQVNASDPIPCNDK
ncbi:hypothetical protein [Cyclobacterium sp.]|uniref:hypothetical protein n=1 Tax=Cyclobacterium sp. TaxID=1966343 RepID=UPI0025BC3A9D|nr:hypothetical protein [Cyclobacterium sp.]